MPAFRKSGRQKSSTIVTPPCPELKPDGQICGGTKKYIKSGVCTRCRSRKNASKKKGKRHGHARYRKSTAWEVMEYEDVIYFILMTKLWYHTVGAAHERSRGNCK